MNITNHIETLTSKLKTDKGRACQTKISPFPLLPPALLSPAGVWLGHSWLGIQWCCAALWPSFLPPPASQLDRAFPLPSSQNSRTISTLLSSEYTIMSAVVLFPKMRIFCQSDLFANNCRLFYDILVWRQNYMVQSILVMKSCFGKQTRIRKGQIIWHPFQFIMKLMTQHFIFEWKVLIAWNIGIQSTQCSFIKVEII